MTLGLWIEEDHIANIWPIVRYFNFERSPDEEARCETLQIKIHLVYFSQERRDLPSDPPTYRQMPFGLYLFPRKREWKVDKEILSTSDSAQRFFGDFQEMMDFACDVKLVLNKAGIDTYWSIDFHRMNNP